VKIGIILIGNIKWEVFMSYKYDPNFHVDAEVLILGGKYKGLEGIIVKFKATLYGNWYAVKLSNGKIKWFTLEEMKNITSSSSE
jgi:hypothetical protein